MNREIKNSFELQRIVSEWVNTFNFVQLEVLEKMSENVLFEYIRQPKPDYDKFLNNYKLWDEYKEWLNDNEYEDDEDNKQVFCEDECDDFQNFMDERSGENYPMWNTCFEFKNDERDDVIQAAMDAGFGIIEGLEPFNTILFVAGCGYSFYGHHWIPLFLNLPWNEDIKKQVEEEGIKYHDL